ncbi:MAG: alpha/beta hydrolase [Acidobacteria bacterium]|nr:alpha/beta hydrolase [Acidobacteriota bacterium]
MKLAVLFWLASLAWAQGDLSGKWDVVASPEGRTAMKMGALLKHDGAELTGTVSSAAGSGPLKNAVLGNPHLTFQFLLGKYVFDVKAVVEGSEIKGTFTGPRNMKGSFLAKRADLLAVVAPAEGVEAGKLGSAEYRIDIPKDFNGSLIVYCHGYSPAPGRFDKDKAPTALTKAFLELGYAVAQSGYSTGGWAVKEALEESEAVRKYFLGKYGKPKRTYVTGHSMGGTITMAMIESFPDAYDAALQMCGPVGPSHTGFQKRVFDALVVYDYYFPGILGSPVEITDDVASGLEFMQRIQKEATTYPDRLSAFQKWGGFLSDTEMAQVVAFFAVIQKELIARGGGNAFDNRNTLYQGSPDDGALNRGVKRYTADANAVEYLKKYYTPKADLKQPVLSLHTTYDPLVPAWSANAYGELARLNGGDSLYVQRFVSRNGHCNFTPQETVRAFQDLVTWKETGKRPESGEQK